MVINYELLGKRIKELRRVKGLSQAALAECVDVSDPYMSLIETGKKKIGLEVLVIVADRLGVAVDYLLFGYQIERDLYDGCTNKEIQIISDVALATKNSLLKNRKL